MGGSIGVTDKWRLLKKPARASKLQPLNSIKILICSAGADTGAFQVGVLQKLAEDKMNLGYDIVVGSSVGALHAYMLGSFPKKDFRIAIDNFHILQLVIQGLAPPSAGVLTRRLHKGSWRRGVAKKFGNENRAGHLLRYRRAIGRAV